MGCARSPDARLAFCGLQSLRIYGRMSGPDKSRFTGRVRSLPIHPGRP
jgi:hypothetical protein